MVDTGEHIAQARLNTYADMVAEHELYNANNFN